nr:unnamed protein product [Haemonchus contortus]
MEFCLEEQHLSDEMSAASASAYSWSASEEMITVGNAEDIWTRGSTFLSFKAFAKKSDNLGGRPGVCLMSEGNHPHDFRFLGVIKGIPDIRSVKELRTPDSLLHLRA